MSHQAEQDVLDHASYPPAQKFALYRIAGLVNDMYDMRYWQKNSILAEQIGVTRQTVSGWMQDFVSDGWLTIVGESKGGRSCATEYAWAFTESVGSADSIAETESVGLSDESVGLTAESVGHPDTQRVQQDTKRVEKTNLPASRRLALAAQAQIQAEFDEWWEMVPRKKAKGGALKAYRTARKKVSAETIFDGTRRWVAESKGKDLAYVPYPATWLNQERWADDPEPQQVRDRSSGASPIDGLLELKRHRGEL